MFTVAIREVHVSYRDVIANTWREAVEKAQQGNYEHEYVEYSHTLDNAPIDITPCNPDANGDCRNDTDDYMNEPESEKDKVRSRAASDSD